MKKKLFTLGVAALFLIGASFISSCGDSQSSENQDEQEQVETDEIENTDSNQTAAVYACPMHPEEKGKEEDKCSKCGMPLEKADTEEEDHSGHDHD